MISLKLMNDVLEMMDSSPNMMSFPLKILDKTMLDKTMLDKTMLDKTMLDKTMLDKTGFQEALYGESDRPKVRYFALIVTNSGLKVLNSALKLMDFALKW